MWEGSKKDFTEQGFSGLIPEELLEIDFEDIRDLISFDAASFILL